MASLAYGFGKRGSFHVRTVAEEPGRASLRHPADGQTGLGSESHPALGLGDIRDNSSCFRVFMLKIIQEKINKEIT